MFGRALEPIWRVNSEQASSPRPVRCLQSRPGVRSPPLRPRWCFPRVASGSSPSPEGKRAPRAGWQIRRAPGSSETVAFVCRCTTNNGVIHGQKYCSTTISTTRGCPQARPAASRRRKLRENTGDDVRGEEPVLCSRLVSLGYARGVLPRPQPFHRRAPFAHDLTRHRHLPDKTRNAKRGRNRGDVRRFSIKQRRKK